jgi:hypothetical protein
MKKIVEILAVSFLAATLGSPLVARAVSYPILEEHRQIKEKAVMKIDTTIYLFHSGTPDARKAIRVNDVLIVYREGPACEMKEVGKIKVLSFAGKNYIKGVVVEGEIKEDDMAKKGAVSYLVILSEDKCK